jgi:hypothetical protein
MFSISLEECSTFYFGHHIKFFKAHGDMQGKEVYCKCSEYKLRLCKMPDELTEYIEGKHNMIVQISTETERSPH